MQVSSKISYRSLTAGTWWYIATFLLVVFPLLLFLVFQDAIYDWYLVRFVQPTLEADLGFTGGSLPVRWGETMFDTFALVSVAPGGTFARAGVRPGDIPVGYVHGIRSSFLGHLQAARGHPVTLHFVNVDQFHASNRRVREVSVLVPADTPPN
jgi:hypothetical protein